MLRSPPWSQCVLPRAVTAGRPSGAMRHQVGPKVRSAHALRVAKAATALAHPLPASTSTRHPYRTRRIVPLSACMRAHTCIHPPMYSPTHPPTHPPTRTHACTHLHGQAHVALVLVHSLQGDHVLVACQVVHDLDLALHVLHLLGRRELAL